MKKILPIYFIVFLSAFLLFQIELIISKIFLPTFGGSYLVWGACVVLFQGLLLLGYLYSHLVLRKIGIHRYRFFHVVLQFLPLLLCFPGKPLSPVYSHQQIPIVLDIFWQLSTNIGLVFFVLSTTSIIFQGWLALSALPQRNNPYALYAVSNFGSFAALLTYPFFFETFFDLGVQLFIWQIGYLALLTFNIITFRLVSVERQDKKKEQGSFRVGAREQVVWFLLGAGGSAMFLSVTNIITYNIAPIPLLWVLPLCIYLISFVLNFKKVPWYPEWIRESFHVTAGLSMFFFFWKSKNYLPFMFELAGYLVSLFIVCMFCQNELIRRKPANQNNFTIFYVLISVGSFAGSILVSWIMPLISTSMIEYLAGFFIIALALSVGGAEKINLKLSVRRLLLYSVPLLIIGSILLLKQHNVLGMTFFITLFIIVYSMLKAKPYAFLLSVAATLCLSPGLDSKWASKAYVYKQRNFYGIYKIHIDSGKLFLAHGITVHGAQYLSGEKQAEPLQYFYRQGPVGDIMDRDTFKFKNIGVIGLGAGTLAAYGKPEQTIDFFELDPEMYNIAANYFTYLDRSKSKINFIFGDARLSLNRIPPNTYDLLVIDAFSGDSIPVHLLTTEAISLYRSRLKKDGILLFHVSNWFLNLEPVLFSNARVLNSYACNKYKRVKPPSDFASSQWVVLTWNRDVYKMLVSQFKWSPSSSYKGKFARPWTDRYSNLLGVFKLKTVFSQMTDFRVPWL